MTNMPASVRQMQNGQFTVLANTPSPSFGKWYYFHKCFIAKVSPQAPRQNSFDFVNAPKSLL